MLEEQEKLLFSVALALKRELCNSEEKSWEELGKTASLKDLTETGRSGEKRNSIVQKTEENRKIEQNLEGKELKQGGEWTEQRVGRKKQAGAGKVVTRSHVDSSGNCHENRHGRHMHVLTHVNYWTFIIYRRICDAFPPVFSGTVGSIWVQFNLSKAFPHVQSHLLCSKDPVVSINSSAASPFANLTIIKGTLWFL